MSWLYGQTWLWYLIAFLVGVLLAWLVLVRPQQRRLDALQNRAGSASHAATPAAAAGVGGAAPAAFAMTKTEPDVAAAEPVTEEFEPVTEQFEPPTEQFAAVNPALSTLDSAKAAQEDTVVIEPAAGAGLDDDETVTIAPAGAGAAPTGTAAVAGSEVDEPTATTGSADAAEGSDESAAIGDDDITTSGDVSPAGPSGSGVAGAAADAGDAGHGGPAAAAQGGEPATAGAASVGAADVAPTTEAPTGPPYGPGSARPAADGSSPHADYTIKGNGDSMLYHSYESPYYVRTRAEAWFATTEAAEAAGFQPWHRNRKRAAVQGIAATPSFEPGPYPGSAKPRSDGSAPTDAFTIKGNEDSMLYHLPSSPYYGRTRAEVWFSTEADAEAAGFTQYRRS